jgi:hypothetical protein
MTAGAAHPSMPLDAHLELILIAIALVTGIVLTVIVFVRNRRPDSSSERSVKPTNEDEGPDHPG